MHVRTTSLSGWGRHPVVDCRVTRPEKRAALQDLVTGDEASLLPRGAGRSYGDAALSAQGVVADTTRLDRMLGFDPETGWLRAEAGVTIREILNVFVPRGWFPPVTPGTKDVTLGGAIAFDVHGKNHHCDGGISNFVTEFDLLTASGETVTCSREDNADLFWATVSGAGLTGIITEVTLQLRPIETAQVKSRHVKARDLDEAFAIFEEHEPEHTYAVAWIDCLASGSDLGRSICTFGDHATREDLAGVNGRAADARDYQSQRLFNLPVDLPSGLLNRWTVRAFNRLYYARQRSRDVRQIEGIDPFFYPLDVLGDWNRMYGSDGFVQYQCVLPMEESYDGLTRLLTRLSDAGEASFLAVLKRMGPEDGGLLSFPMRGYTLALDIPYRDGLDDFLHELDRIVLDHGGRVYLAKDAALEPDTFRAMYPGFDDFLDVKRRVDPHNRFASTLSRRLDVHP
jgi:FAD/FMN-containing dehydrogenase